MFIKQQRIIGILGGVGPLAGVYRYTKQSSIIQKRTVPTNRIWKCIICPEVAKYQTGQSTY